MRTSASNSGRSGSVVGRDIISKTTRLGVGARRLLLVATLTGFVLGCSAEKDDGYLSPPSDPKAFEKAAQQAIQELASATYASVGKPFGCDTDCKDEELGFAEARQDGVTKSEDCTTRFSDKSLMSNATQDGCRAYVQALLGTRDLLERSASADGVTK
jgi:hypothetical protein